MMLAGARERLAPHVLTALAMVLIASAFVWVRNVFGFVALVTLGILIALGARFLPFFWSVVLAQIIAVQMALASWSSREYLFMDGFDRDGQRIASDTQRIADEWFLPYWFWGGLLGGASIAVLAWAFWRAWLHPQVDQPH